MDGIRAPQGLDAEDKVALGLTASHLFYLVIFAMAGWAILSSPLPIFLRDPLGVTVLVAGALLAWGRIQGRPLDRWIMLSAAFLVRPRASAATSVDSAVDVLPREAVVEARPRPQRDTSMRPLNRRARRVAFYSQTGGAGKTTLSVEAATLVAFLSRVRVALVDLDPVSTTMRVRTGIEGVGLDEVASGAVPGGPALESALHRLAGGVRVAVDGSLEVFSAALVDYLDAQFDVVVFDLGTGALERETAATRALVETLDTVYCVLNPTPGGVMGVYRAVATLRRAGLRDRLRLVTNRHDSPALLDDVLGDLRLVSVASVPTLRGLEIAECTHAAACLVDEAVSDALYPVAEDIFPDLSAAWFRRAQATAG